MNIDTLREFLGWCTVINVGLMFFSWIMIMLLQGWASKLHAGMFNLDEASVRRAYFQYFANYKIAVIVLNLVPYLALAIMGGS